MKKIRLLAPLSLAMSTVLFAATFPFQDMFAFALLHAFAEASMIGGLADWFAVVALFRHPFGIPIPHTAIIPAQRAKLTTGIIDIVQNTWLNKETIKERVRTWELIPRLLRSLEDADNRATMMRVLRSGIRRIALDTETETLSEKLLDFVRRNITTDDLLAWIRAAARRGIEHGQHHRVFDLGLRNAADWLGSERVRRTIAANLEKIATRYSSTGWRRFFKGAAETFDLLNYDDLAAAVIATLRQDLEAMLADPVHPARASFDEWLASFAATLGENDEVRDIVEKWRRDLIESGRLRAAVESMIAGARQRLIDDLVRPDSEVMRVLEGFISRGIERFRDNADARTSAETWLKEQIVRLVEGHHGAIGDLVRHNLERLDDDQLVEQIEAKVGGDLQFIRLNGAVVGGLVGAVIFLIQRLLA